MAVANPNPSKVTNELWRFTQECDLLTADVSFSRENGGTYAMQAGFHGSRDDQYALGRPNDYSIRDPLNKQGPSDKCAAWDWTFPSAQAGDWSKIGVFSRRIEAAWNARDPRCYGLHEVLCQTPEDKQPEGFVFYPTHFFRVPDSTHEWHMHFSFVRKFVADWDAFAAILSILAGESLATWNAGHSKYKGDDDMANADDILSGAAVGITSDGYYAETAPAALVTAPGVGKSNLARANLLAVQQHLDQIDVKLNDLAAKVAAPAPAPELDYQKLAVALLHNLQQNQV